MKNPVQPALAADCTGITSAYSCSFLHITGGFFTPPAITAEACPRFLLSGGNFCHLPISN
jgi:hypothetical protein